MSWSIFIAWPAATLSWGKGDAPCLVPSNPGKKEFRSGNISSCSRWSTKPEIIEEQFMPTGGSGIYALMGICHPLHYSDPSN